MSEVTDAVAANLEAASEVVEVTQQAGGEQPQPVVEYTQTYESLEDAAAALLAFVDDGRRAGDGEVDIAREELRAALAALAADEADDEDAQ